MASQVKAGTFYYSNDDWQAGARVSRELVCAFFESFSGNLKSSETLAFIEQTRIPNERELYGLFIKSLYECELKNQLGHVATEFQIGRGDDSMGRVDVFFNYRGTSFLVELKVARVGLPRDDMGQQDAIDVDEESNPIIRIVKPWNGKNSGVVAQLQNLNVESLVECLHRKVVKMPMVVYLYVDWRTSGARAGWQQLASETHQYIINNLSSNRPAFEYFTVLDSPVRTRKRRSGLSDGHNMNLYGFSLVASALS